MKTLTLHQPWATLVALGAKQIETRSWAASYRGPLAAAGYDSPYKLPAGRVIAIATLAAIYPIVDADKILVYDAVYIVHDPERTTPHQGT
jgi:hypothetical protein